MASLRGRLLALVLGATALVWAGTLLASWLDARRAVGEVLDGHLAQAASLLIVQLGEELDDIDRGHARLLHPDAQSVAFQVWEDGKRLRLHSSNAPSSRLGPRTPGFSTRTVDGTSWRVFSAWDRSHDFLVYVGEQTSVRSALAGRMIAGLLWPLLAALPLLALLLWVAIRRGLRPLERLAADVGRRQPDSLAPLDAGRAPREVLPLISQLNRLFARIAATFERERRFTADAAHELRTPVAAIKAQAQVAQLSGAAAPREHALAQVVAGADRAGRLVEQLLVLARLDAAGAADVAPGALRPLAAGVLAGLAPAALAGGATLELADGGEVSLAAMPGLVEVLLRNLLDNALRHGARRVRVEVGTDASGTILSVVDDGPGIPVGERVRVLERFHRLAGAGEGGSGLGLSIVQRIVELHGATLSLASGDGGRGLRVSIRFPAA